MPTCDDVGTVMVFSTLHHSSIKTNKNTKKIAPPQTTTTNEVLGGGGEGCGCPERERET